MMKSSELVLMVDSVEEAIKFYTEKLAFDLVDIQVNKEGSQSLVSAHLRKGKCCVLFKVPQVEELAEFSFIKRCASRCIGLQVFMKKGLEKYYQRCQKKGVKIVSDLRDMGDGTKMFSARDPFGIKLYFVEPLPNFVARPSTDFLGVQLKKADSTGKPLKDGDMLDQMVDHLKSYGVLRRAGKKFAKLKLKELQGKAKKK